ncbi:MAG: His-Xaa-Ser system protein HxsD [Myxococcales bacterium]|nr:His-Xaa-Ser system protein HxsD [Myxococcales bacterium]
MSAQLSEVPSGLLSVNLESATVTLTVDAELYPLQALYGASYIFIDRCYVFLDRAAEGKFQITLAPKDANPDPEALRSLVGEFANELLSCAWRHQITQDNRVQIETVTMQAIAGAMGEPSLDDLAAFDFSDEAFDDPLGIAQSWEEKHGKKPPAEEAETSSEGQAEAPAESPSQDGAEASTGSEGQAEESAAATGSAS